MVTVPDVSDMIMIIILIMTRKGLIQGPQSRQGTQVKYVMMMVVVVRVIMMVLRMKWRSSTGESPTSTRSRASPLYSRYVADDD